MKIRHALIGIGVVATSILAAPAQALILHDYVDFKFVDLIVLDHTVGNGPEKKTTDQYKYLTRFDSSYGWLTDVTIGWKSDWGLLGTSEAIKFGLAGARGRAGIDMRVDLVDPNRPPVNDTHSVQTSCRDGGICIDTEHMGGSFNRIFDPVLAPFIGTDPLKFKLTHTTKANLLGCDGLCSTTGSSKWAGRLFVKYEFEKHEVPEPSVIALLGMGLFGITIASAFKRRRKS